MCLHGYVAKTPFIEAVKGKSLIFCVQDTNLDTFPTNLSNHSALTGGTGLSPLLTLYLQRTPYRPPKPTNNSLQLIRAGSLSVGKAQYASC